MHLIHCPWEKGWQIFGRELWALFRFCWAWDVISTSIRRHLICGRKVLLGQKYLVFSGRSVNCQTRDGSWVVNLTIYQWQGINGEVGRIVYLYTTVWKTPDNQEGKGLNTGSQVAYSPEELLLSARTVVEVGWQGKKLLPGCGCTEYAQWIWPWKAKGSQKHACIFLILENWRCIESSEEISRNNKDEMEVTWLCMKQIRGCSQKGTTGASKVSRGRDWMRNFGGSFFCM